MKKQPTPFSLRSKVSRYSEKNETHVEEKKTYSKIIDRSLIRKITGRE